MESVLAQLNFLVGYDLLDSFLAPLTSILPIAQLRVAFVLFISFPLSAVFLFLKTPEARNLYSILLGFYFGCFAIGVTIIHSLGSSLIVYIMLKLNAKPSLIFAFAFLHLWIGFAHRIWTEDVNWTMDWTASQMQLCMKLVSLGFNYNDGKKKEKDFPFEKEAKEQQIRDSVPTVPSLLDFYGYVYYFPAFLAGPPMSYREYKSFIDQTNFPETNRPSTILPGFKSLASTMFYCFCYLQAGKYFPVHREALNSDYFRNLSLFDKLIHTTIGLFGERARFSTIWGLSESASVLSGLAYDKETGKWDRMTNLRQLKVELAESPRDLSENWNIKCSAWLRYYVYFRVLDKNQKTTTLSLFITYFVSALWHGFYSGYFFFFISLATYTVVGREIRRAFQPPLKDKPVLKFIYDRLGNLFTVSFLNFSAISFMVLTFTDSVVVMKDFFFYPYILCVLGYVLAQYIKKAFPSSRSSKTPTTTVQGTTLATQKDS